MSAADQQEGPIEGRRRRSAALFDRSLNSIHKVDAIIDEVLRLSTPRQPQGELEGSRLISKWLQGGVRLAGGFATGLQPLHGLLEGH